MMPHRYTLVNGWCPQPGKRSDETRIGYALPPRGKKVERLSGGVFLCPKSGDDDVLG